MKKTLLLLGLLTPSFGFAQAYSIDWFKVAGGGGTSTGSVYSVNGTIGQPDAGGAMAGGNYSVTGGFWSLISVVQAAGVPELDIAANGPGSVKILWPDTGSYTLLQSASLDGGSWVTNHAAISTVSGTNFITLTPATGKLFFRLANP